jgi:multiple sugar transport system permease protein
MSRPASRGFLAAALAPFAAFLLVLGAYPVVQLVRMAFSEVSVSWGRFEWRYIGLDNFSRLFDEGAAGESVRATLVFTAFALPLSIVLGTVLALAMDRARWLGPLARGALLWPAVMTPVVISVLWLLILSPTIGALNRALASLGWPEQTWLDQAAGAMGAVVFVDVWHWTPVVFLVAYTAIKGIDHEVVEAARVDAASELRLIWHIVLPMIRPALLAVAAIRLVMCVKAFDEMYLLTKGGPDGATNMVSLYIRTVFFDGLELGYGAAFGLMVVLAVLAIAGVWYAARRLVRVGSPA